MTDQAELLILGAPVWTGDPAWPWADAVALHRRLATCRTRSRCGRA